MFFLHFKLQRSRILENLTVLQIIKKFEVCYLHISIYIQQDATLHSLFYLETALHVSGGTTAHHQERMQLYLQHLVFVRPLLLSAAIFVCFPTQIKEV